MMTSIIAIALLFVVAKAQTIGGCNLCVDGSMPTNLDVALDNPLFNITTGIDLSGYTCGTFMEELLLIPTGNETCTLFTDFTGLPYVCGCPSAVKQCSICPDGSLPTFSDVMIPEVGLTCGDLDPLFSFLGTDICQNVTDVGLATFCGCSSDGSTIAPVIPGSSTVAPFAGSTAPVIPGSSTVAPFAGSTAPVIPGTSTVAPIAGSTAPVIPGSSTVAPFAGSTAPVIPGSSTVAPFAGSTVSPVTAGTSSAPFVAPVGGNSASVTVAPATAAPFAASVAPATTLAPSSMTVPTEGNITTLAPTSSSMTSKPVTSGTANGGIHAMADVVAAVAVMALLVL